MKKTTSRRVKPVTARVSKPDAEQFAPVSTLWFGCHDIKSQNFDWQSGFGETWESYEAHACDKCGAAIVNARGEQHCDVDSETQCDGYAGSSDGPMMNYFYPMPTFDGDPVEAAKKLVHLPLCVVEFLGDVVDNDDRYALALTGGGMDLGWEICEAFMRLGYLPPISFAERLPQMSGRGTSERDRWIIAGCRRSLQGAKESVGRALRRLRENFPAGGAQ